MITKKVLAALAVAAALCAPALAQNSLVPDQRPGLPTRPAFTQQVRSAPFFSNIVPAIHLKNFSGTNSPVVCAIGDSTLTGDIYTTANNITVTDVTWGRIERAMMEANPSKTITFKNFAVGGTVASQFNTVLASGWPAWYSNHSNTWTSYVAAANCNVIFMQWGLNDNGSENGNIWKTNVLTPILAYSTPADLIFNTNIPANVDATQPFNTPAYQSGFVSNQTLQRTIAQNPNALGLSGLPPLGFIDIGRYFNALIYGTDYVEQPLTYIVFPASPLPVIALSSGTPSYVLPPTPGGDFYLSFTLNNGSAMQSAGSVMSLFFDNGRSDGTGVSDQVNFQTNNGTNCYGNIFPSGLSSINANNFSWSSTNNTFEFTGQNGHIRVTCNGVLIQDIVMPRVMGPGWTPTLTLVTPPAGTTNLIINAYAVGSPTVYPVSLTKANVYGQGSGIGPNSGNGINHVSSYGLASAIGTVIDNVNFQAPLLGVTASLGGGALLAGACASGTVTVSGAAVGMKVTATPNTYPGDGAYWYGYVSAANTVTVKVCAAIALTPTASTYNVVLN